MAISKIIFNGVVQMDVTGDTVAANNLLTGFTATGADGEQVIGQYQGGGGDSWSWMGKNPTKVKDYGTTKVWLKDCGYNTWTPTTTSTEIVSRANLEAYTADFGTYSYYVLMRFHSHFEYGSGATGTAQIDDVYWICANECYKYHSNYSAMSSGTPNTQTYQTDFSGGMFYISTTGANTYTASATYGVFPYTAPSLTLSSTSITPATPQINARCNASYFSTAAAATVDKNTSYYELKTEIWRVDNVSSEAKYLRDDIRDMWLNGIS